jgi:DNA repair protein SbcC/Rad50
LRPRFLEIEGLQSFKEVQKIDFDHLSETGIFGIFGPTGSGKSTVLDAITLALYGKVHRATNGTQGIINSGQNIVKVSFTFDILKGGNRKTYKVERTYSRKKGTENSCEAKVARLIEITEAGELPIVDKHGEVSDRVEELLGLKHEDFTRAVVLPQNKFQEFLFLKNADKSKMLERIFYLEEYGRQLSEKVSSKLYGIKNKLAGVQGALSMLGDASDNAIAEADQRLTDSQILMKNVSEEFKLLETRFIEAKEVWGLVSELNFVIGKEQEHLSEQGDISERRVLLERAKKADSLIELIEKYNENLKNLSETEELLKEINIKLPESSKELENTKILYEKTVKQADVEKPKLIERKTKLINALEIKKEILDIDRKISEMRINFKSIKEKITAQGIEIEKAVTDAKKAEANTSSHKAKIEELSITSEYRNDIQNGVRLEDELKAALKNMEMYKFQFSELFSKVSELDKKQKVCLEAVRVIKESLETLSFEEANHVKEKPCDRAELTYSIENYHSLKALIVNLKSKKIFIESVKSKTENAKGLLENRQIILKEALVSRNNIDAEKYNYSQEIQKLKKLIEKNSAYMLAKELADGEECPVCGSTSHPVLASEEIDIGVTELEQKLKLLEHSQLESETALRNAENNCIALTEQVKTIEQQLIQFNMEYLDGEKEYQDQLGKLPKDLQVISITELEAELEKTDKENSRKLNALGEWEIKNENLKSSILKLKDELSKRQVEENGVNAEMQVNSENLSQIERSEAEAAQVYRERNLLYSDFLKKYNIQEASTKLNQISENDKMAESIFTQINQQQEVYRVVKERIDALEKGRQELSTSLTEIETDGKHLKAQKDEKELKIKELCFGEFQELITDSNIDAKVKEEVDIEVEICLIEEKIEELYKAEKQLLSTLKNSEEHFNSINMQKNTLENQRDIYKKTQETENDRLLKTITEKGFVDKEEVQKSILAKEQQKNLNEAIENYDKEDRNLHAQKNMIVKKLDKRNISEEEWNKVEQSFIEKNIEREKSVSGYEVTKSIYFNVKERHDKWRILNKDFRELSRKEDQLDQIKTLLKGNSFIEYIAEERLRYIAQEASETLGIMTKFRYVLELDSDCGFIIRDNANGGVHRMVSSLSGGETFLTSLSLALALSKQIQLKGQSPLEFFFLDEGFGTLDSNLLDTVIDSLEKLSSRERVIGLISHVPELRNRISRRLVIEPPTSTGAGSVIRIEKA